MVFYQQLSNGRLLGHRRTTAHQLRIENKVGPTQWVEPVPFESTTDVNQPKDVSADDLLSLYPGGEK